MKHALGMLALLLLATGVNAQNSVPAADSTLGAGYTLLLIVGLIIIAWLILPRLFTPEKQETKPAAKKWPQKK